MKNVMMYVVTILLVIAAVTKDIWFNTITEHTRDADSSSKIVFLELE